MNKSESIAKLAKALAGFQGEVATIGTDRKNPFFKTDYATLGQLIEDTKALRQKWGLSVSQFPEGEGGLVTILMHESGEWLEATSLFTLEKEKGNSLAQSAGKLITYQRRYAYASVLGLVSDADADGNMAQSEYDYLLSKFSEEQQTAIEAMRQKQGINSAINAMKKRLSTSK